MSREASNEAGSSTRGENALAAALASEPAPSSVGGTESESVEPESTASELTAPEPTGSARAESAPTESLPEEPAPADRVSVESASAGTSPIEELFAETVPVERLPNESVSAAPGAHAAPPVVVAPAAPARAGLSTFLKVSIILLAALSIAAVALVFVGDFEGKVERITATFLIFAVFVALTGFDTTREQRNGWYAPVALIANSYILALLLLVIWMSAGGFFLGTSIFWKSILVIAVTRAVVAACQVLLGMGEGKPEPLGRFAFVTSVLAVVSGILFTAPLAIEVFRVEVPELYWKIAVAALLLTGLGLAITLLLRWSYGSEDREAKRKERLALAAEQLAQAASAPALAPPPAQNAALFGAATAQPLLPWPTFADGRPLPAGPDGQPDFSVPGAPKPTV